MDNEIDAFTVRTIFSQSNSLQHARFSHVYIHIEYIYIFIVRITYTVEYGRFWLLVY